MGLRELTDHFSVSPVTPTSICYNLPINTLHQKNIAKTKNIT